MKLQKHPDQEHEDFNKKSSIQINPFKPPEHILKLVGSNVNLRLCGTHSVTKGVHHLRVLVSIYSLLIPPPPPPAYGLHVNLISPVSVINSEGNTESAFHQKNYWQQNVYTPGDINVSFFQPVGLMK